MVMLVVRYPLEQIDFRPWARSTLSVERLEDLHLRPDPVPFANYVERLQYYTSLLRDNFHPAEDQYLALVDRIAPLFDGLVLRQRPPSFRCHLPGAGTASAFHRDGDPKYGITPGTINAWVPLTPVGGSNSLHVESELGSEAYRPVSMQPGEILIFDAFHLKHGSYANKTQTTRISFDFRFLPNNRDLVRTLGISATEPPS
jgi:ectoine hydroxylase-related dioxygenase (phytanoyl-CoA dioxygenase family)